MPSEVSSRTDAELAQLGAFALGDLLADAAEHGTAEEVRRVLAAGAPPDHRHGADEWTPLMHAASRGDAAMVEALLAAGADANETVFDAGLYAAVTLAAVKRRRAVEERLRTLTSTETLEDTGPWDPRQKEKFDKRVTALVRAARAGRLRRIEQLVALGADVDGLGDDGVTPLVAAAGAGRLDAVEVLLRFGARADLRERYRLPLYGVVGAAVVQRLIRAGADPNGVPSLGSTPLIVAASVRRVDEARTLIEAGADVEVKDAEGKTALAVAAERGDVEMIGLLMGAGADVDARTPGGRTPLLLALRSVDAVRALLDGGADANAREKDGQTALMRAKDVAVTRLMLERGADPALADAAGNTALILARQPAIAAALIAGGSPIDAQNAEGRTALMYAAKRRDVELVEPLLAAGADVSLKDTAGQDALSLARGAFGGERVVAMLEAAQPRRG